MKPPSLYEVLAEQFKDDPQFEAESHLIGLTEKLCEINQSRRTRIAVWLIERIAGYIIDRSYY